MTLSPHKLRMLVRDNRGVAAIELAFVAPVIMFAILGAYDLSRAVTRTLDLEQAAQRVSELAQAKPPLSTNALGYLETEAATAAGGSATADIDLTLECNGVVQADFNMSCGAGQLMARYIRVNVTESFVPELDLSGLARMAGASGYPSSFTLSGSSTVRLQ